MAFSSNSFANGANQNAGNVLSDRSSTRRIAAPGGYSTITLGTEEHEKMSCKPLAEDEAATPLKPAMSDTSTPRVKRTPGGNSSIGDLLGGEAPALGGEVTGKLTSSNCFADGNNPNSGNILTARPSTRLHFAPGGESTIGDLLGGEAPSLGGEVTGKLTSNSFANGANPNAGNVLTERSSTRLHCPPGGISTITLGGDGQEDIVSTTTNTRIAPGGVSTIQLGGSVDQTSVAEASGNRVAPGGVSTLILGGGPPLEPPEPRTAPGGISSVVLGTALPTEQFSHREVGTLMDVPEPTARFPCAPGGNSSLVFGASEEPLRETAVRVAPGGPSSIVLGGDAVSTEASSSVRVAPGGEATISLGSEVSADRFNHRQEQPLTAVPDPRPRFPCAPGGNSTIEFSTESTIGAVSDQPSNRVAPGGASTIVLGGDSTEIDASSVTIRTAPGGEATIVLGEEVSADRFRHRQEEVMTMVPDPCPRFPCAPGGKSTIELSTSSTTDTAASLPSGRVAPGGTSTIALGGESPSDALPNSTCTRGPVGGETTILLGNVADAERFMRHENDLVSIDGTPAPASRFPCAPGGHATINLTSENLPSDEPVHTGRTAPGGKSSVILGGDFLPGEIKPVNSNGPAPGGNATVVLGTEAPADCFSHREAVQLVDVPDPTPRFSCAPGGNSSVILGSGEEMKGRSLTDKLTRVAKLDDESSTTNNVPQARISNESNVCSKACDSGPTPRFPCAPGGNSSVLLGSDEEMKGRSLTDKLTRVAKVCDENKNIANLPQANVSNDSKIQTPSKAFESSAVILG